VTPEPLAQIGREPFSQKVTPHTKLPSNK
jgi:hypothetical protein